MRREVAMNWMSHVTPHFSCFFARLVYLVFRMMADNRSGISCTSAIIYIQMVLLNCIETCSFFNDLLHIITHCCVAKILFACMRASHLSMAQHLNSVITLLCVFFCCEQKWRTWNLLCMQVRIPRTCTHTFTYLCDAYVLIANVNIGDFSR